jgi:hypothetical protein
MKRRTFFGVLGAVLGAACGVKAAQPDDSGGFVVPPDVANELRAMMAKWKRSAASQLESAKHEPLGATTSTANALQHGAMCYINSALAIEELLVRTKA